ncbi:MAG TPA: VCBS repeat-containing protein, partial [Candidatus Hydrogenedentes bacterium]|nr:VCBS repeat-containing protein [Candidatus Hydrogenedentota bacterium]
MKHAALLWVLSCSVALTCAVGLHLAAPRGSAFAPSACIAAAAPPVLLKVSPPPLTHETWGRTYYGDGYVYGPTSWRSSMAVVDIEGDGDNDFAFRANYDVPPQIMRNLGTRTVFFPGGLKDLNIADPEPGVYLELIMDFQDVTNDGRPDLVAVANAFDPNATYIAYYKNQGPAEGALSDEPTFAFVDYVYTSAQANIPEIALDISDLNGDGLLDLVFVEFFAQDVDAPHRVYFMANEGTSQTPEWADPVEIAALTAIMPDAIPVKAGKAEQPDAGIRDGKTLPAGVTLKADPTQKVRLSDIEVYDWDGDGVLDFLFYDALEGIDWVRNTGTTTTPEWANVLNDGGTPPWRHGDLAAYGIPDGRYENLEKAFGTFALSDNPESGLPHAKWRNDFCINMEGWLITRRYFTGDDAGYRLVQENSLEYPTGQGPAAFADADGDGVLDMFRTGVGSSSTAYLLAFTNIGTPYAPAWGRKSTCRDIVLSKGNAANHYRQDLYTFADVDNDGMPDFFVQGQDGVVKQYTVDLGMPPVFTLVDEDVGGAVQAGLSNIEPRGLAVADFVQSPVGLPQLLVAYVANDEGHLLFVPQEAKDAVAWGDPVDLAGTLEDEWGGALDLRRIESLAAGDVDCDGLPDLVVAIGDYWYSGGYVYTYCAHYLYRNVSTPAAAAPAFEFVAWLDAVYNVDQYGGRMPSLADIDADGDADLFLGHEFYFPGYESRRHYLRFYRNSGDTGIELWRTRVVSGQTWTLAIGGLLPEYRWVSNTSGGELAENAQYTAGATSGVVDIVESVGLTPNYRVFVDVLPAVASSASKAIIVVGGATSDPLYTTFQDIAARVYWALLSAGLPAENIRMLAGAPVDGDGDGTSDVYAPATLAILESSVLNWASDADELLVQLHDHGQRDRFRLNATQYLEADVYAAWINTLQVGGVDQVTTIVDTCESGSFIDNLSLDKELAKTGATRITMTSAGMGP